ncbi:hypothetical protein M5K25_002562 [Dendrobium thyrsiflorum]|uniref:Uncharacterized protein n=1 Tax=Dendrobium thyrsiflorum TaxID=117978 RepID=A0ABD0VNM3_DENTH
MDAWIIVLQSYWLLIGPNLYFLWFAPLRILATYTYGSLPWASGGGLAERRASGGGPAEHRASGGGLAEHRAFGSGPAELQASSGGPAECRASSGGPAERRASGGGPVECRASGGGPAEHRASGGGPVERRALGGGLAERRALSGDPAGHWAFRWWSGRTSGLQAFPWSGTGGIPCPDLGALTEQKPPLLAFSFSRGGLPLKSDDGWKSDDKCLTTGRGTTWVEVRCWAEVRRKSIDRHKSNDWRKLGVGQKSDESPVMDISPAMVGVSLAEEEELLHEDVQIKRPRLASVLKGERSLLVVLVPVVEVLAGVEGSYFEIPPSF